MNSVAWKNPGLVVAALAVCLPVEARGEEATELSGVIVTAARLDESLPGRLARYGNDLERISAETIRRNAYVDLAQALQMQTPGLFIAPRNGPFSYADLSLQGSRSGDVLWLVDGVRINNRLYASTSPADTLPASMIERVEVLKGGQSLFFGAQAAAGVINVMTRGYSETFDGQLTAGGHSNGGVHADVTLRDMIGPHRFVVWGSKDEADGFRSFDTFQPSATDHRRGYDVVSLGGKYGLDISPDLSLNLYLQHTDAHLEYPGPSLTRSAANDRDEDIASLSIDWTPSELTHFSLKGYYHDWDTVYTTVQNIPGLPNAPPLVVDNLSYWGYEDYGFTALAKLNLHRGFEYQFAYDFQTFSGADQVLLISRQVEAVHAVVAQVGTTDDLFKHARLSAGLRHNRSEGAETTVWNLSAHFDLGTKFYIDGLAGTSFILPSAEQLFAIDPCCAAGNPNLEAEESLNLIATVGRRAGALSWEASAFRRDISHLITDDYDIPAFPDGLYVNTSTKVRTRGVELQANLQLSDALTLQGSYTYTRTRQAGGSGQFPRIPTQQAKGALTWDPPQRPFAASASLVWVDDVFQDVSGFDRQNYGDYVIIDVAAHVWLDGARRRHRLIARLENAMDERYATRLNSARRDLSTDRFLFKFLGAPRTLNVSYSYSF